MSNNECQKLLLRLNSSQSVWYFCISENQIAKFSHYLQKCFFYNGRRDQLLTLWYKGCMHRLPLLWPTVCTYVYLDSLLNWMYDFIKVYAVFLCSMPPFTKCLHVRFLSQNYVTEIFIHTLTFSKFTTYLHH